MAEDIRQNFGTDTAITITPNSLTDGSSATSNSIDLGSPGPFAISIEAKLDGTASSTALCEFYAQWSNDDTDFSDSDNDMFFGTVDMNGTTAVIKILYLPVFARYLKIRVLNNSGATLESSGNTLRYVPITVDQA